MTAHSSDIVGIGSSHRHVQAQYEDAFEDLENSGALVSAEKIDINAVPKESLADAISKIADGRFPENAGDFMNIQVALHRLDEDPGHIDGVPSTRQQKLALREARRIGKREEWLRGEYEFTSGPYKGVAPSNTQVATYRYQSRHEHLVNDAIVGPATLAQIEADLRGLPETPAPVDTARDDAQATLTADSDFQKISGNFDYEIGEDGSILAMAVKPDAVFNAEQRQALLSFVDRDFAGLETSPDAGSAMSYTAELLRSTEAKFLDANRDIADSVESLSVRADGTITELSVDSSLSLSQERFDELLVSGPLELSSGNKEALQRLVSADAPEPEPLVEASPDDPIAVLATDEDYKKISSLLNFGAVNGEVVAFSVKPDASFDTAQRAALQSFAGGNFAGVPVTRGAQDAIRELAQRVGGAEEAFLDNNPDLDGVIEVLSVRADGAITDVAIDEDFELTRERLAALTTQTGVEINETALGRLRARAQAESELQETVGPYTEFNDILDADATIVDGDGTIEQIGFRDISDYTFEYRGRLERLRDSALPLSRVAVEALNEELRVTDGALQAFFESQYASSTVWRGVDSQGHLFDIRDGADFENLGALLGDSDAWTHPAMATQKGDFEEVFDRITEGRAAVQANLDRNYPDLFREPEFVAGSAQVKSLVPRSQEFLSEGQIPLVEDALGDDGLRLEQGARQALEARIQASRNAAPVLAIIARDYSEVIADTDFNAQGELQGLQLTVGLTPTTSDAQFQQLEALLTEDDPGITQAVDARREGLTRLVNSARIERMTGRISTLYGSVVDSLSVSPDGRRVLAFSTSTPETESEREALQRMLQDEQMFASSHSFYRGQQKDLQALFDADDTLSFRFESEQGVTELRTDLRKDSSIPESLKYTVRKINFPNMDDVVDIFADHSSFLSSYPQVNEVFDRNQGWIELEETEGERSSHKYSEGVLERDVVRSRYYLVDDPYVASSIEPPTFFREAFIGRHGFRLEQGYIFDENQKLWKGEIFKIHPSTGDRFGEGIKVVYNSSEDQFYRQDAQDADGTLKKTPLERGAFIDALNNLDQALEAEIRANGLGN